MWKTNQWRKGQRSISAALLFATLGLAGCGQEGATDSLAFQVRDSAGVTIYENSGGEWTEATAWRLSNEPTLTIGIFDGPEEYLLFQARGARRLSNGNIVIANGGTHELRFYDPDGTHVRSVGREGDGPGEFRTMREPWPLGSDSIAIWDSRSARLSVFDVDGEFGRSFQLDPIPDALRPSPLGILADNSLVVSATIRSEGPRRYGLWRDSVLYARYSLEGAHLATLIRRQGQEYFTQDLGGGRYGSTGLFYGLNPTTTVFGDQWYYGPSERWEIEVYSAGGALRHLFRRDEPNRPVTQELGGEDRESVSDSGDAPPATLGSFTINMPPIPETMPAYKSFMVSDDGSLWVENYTHIVSSEQPSWAVFRDDGRYLGVVETPMGAQVTHIADDFVLVIWEDELEVQQVQMYELIKP